ncbi:vesicle-associated membrane protein 3-like [Polypterus senegalus]|nr:vesicle-associated membrane protein 3-like [Polypterus senegalus]
MSASPLGAPDQMRSAAGNVLQKTQAQVDEVVDLMRENMDKVLGRDEKLLELDDRAQALQEGASQFESRAFHLRRKYWWKNCKLLTIMFAVFTTTIFVIIIIFLIKHR